MFDVQIWRHRRDPQVPDSVLGSISAYYHRVTTTASPMGRLVGLVMATLLIALVVQTIDGDDDWWVSANSLVTAVLAIGLAAVRVFGRARRLGERTDPPAIQSDLARSIFRDHLICLALITTLLAVQLAAA